MNKSRGIPGALQSSLLHPAQFQLIAAHWLAGPGAGLQGGASPYLLAYPIASSLILYGVPLATSIFPFFTQSLCLLRQQFPLLQGPSVMSSGFPSVKVIKWYPGSQ